MVLILPIVLLVVAAVLILLIRAVRPGFPALWLIAVLGSISAWLVMLFLRIRLPANFVLLNWSETNIYTASPGLLLDYSSWPYAFAITSLVLAVVLVSPGHLNLRSEVVNIAGSLALGGLGLLAVLAGNPVTLLLGWAAMDIIELLILLRSSDNEASDQAVMQVFSTRVAGIMIALWTFVVGSRTAGFNTSFSDLSPLAGVPLLISIGLRVGIFPLHLPFAGESALRRGQGTLMRMVPAASGLMVLSRIPSSAVSARATAWLAGFTLAALLYASIRWVLEEDELNSRPFWLISMTAFGILSVLTREPTASLSWGASLVFLGSAIFLLEYANRFMRVLLGIGMISMVGLPFTANASGLLGISSTSNTVWIIIAMLGAFLILIGMANKIQKKPDIPAKMEQIIYLTYPVSILLLIFSYLFVGFFGWHGSRTMGSWGLAIILFLLVVGWMVWEKYTGQPGMWFTRIRKIKLAEIDLAGAWNLKNIIDLDWFYTGIRYVYLGLGKLISGITFLLEGSAGLFWGILTLVLFLAILNIGGK